MLEPRQMRGFTQTGPVCWNDVMTLGKSGSLCFQTGKILVLTAIDDELDTERAPEGVEVIYSGVGSVRI